MKDNIKYLLSKDYFKLGIIEKVFSVAEIPLSIMSAQIGYSLSKGNVGVTIASAFIPQVTTYLLSRVLELYTILGISKGYQIFQRYKSMNFKPKSIDDLVGNTKTNHT